MNKTMKRLGLWIAVAAVALGATAAGAAQKLSLAVSDAGNGALTLSFSGARHGSYALFVASGAVDGGADYANWSHTNFIANIAAGVATYDYALPAEFVSEGRYYRFFLMRDAAYRQIEYAENTREKTSNAYIDTGIVPSKDTTIEGECEPVTLDTTVWRHIFGCKTSDKKVYNLGISFGQVTSGHYQWFSETRKLVSGGNTFMGDSTSFEPAAGVHYGFEYGVTNMTVWNVAAPEDKLSQSLLTTAQAENFTGMTKSINLFRALNSDNSTYDNAFRGKIFTLTIFENGTPVRDYVPVKYLADGTVGFYDLVNGDFKPSASAVAFIGGDPVAGDFSVQSATRRAVSKSLPLERGLVAYYTFDEVLPVNHAPGATTVTGVTLNNGTLTGGSAASGVQNANRAHYGFGGYLDINYGGWARLDGSQNLTFENGNDFTLVVWMRTDGIDTRPSGKRNYPAFAGNGDWNNKADPGALLAMDSDADEGEPHEELGGYPICNYADSDSSSGRQFLKSNAAAVGEAAGAWLGKWTFFAISHTSDNKFRFWRSTADGTLVCVTERDAYRFGLVHSTPRYFFLGTSGEASYASSYPFTGQLDEFALWTRGLQPSDIERIYANGRSVNGRPGKTLGDLMSPAMTVEDLGGNRVRLNFIGDRVGNYDLYVASDDSDKGNNFFDWANRTDTGHDVAPGDSSYEYSLPSDITDNHRAYRFFLMKNATYQEIEYIENTDTDTGPVTAPTINTGIVPTKNTSLNAEIEFGDYISGSNTGWQYIFGCQSPNYDSSDVKKKNYFSLGAVSTEKDEEIDDSGMWYVERPYGGDYYPKFGAVSANVRYAIDYCVTNASYWAVSSSDAPVNQVVCNPEDRENFPFSGNQSGGNVMPNISLFRYTGQTRSRPFVGKMYSLQILESGVAVRDYVPATNSTGAVGLYDMKNSQFYESTVTKKFLAGPAVSGRLTIVSDAMKVPGTGDPAGARWIGGAAGALDAPSSWVCTNSAGGAVTGVPQSFTQITIANASELFSVAEGTLFAYRDIAVSGAVALSGDLDWSGIDLAKVSGGTLNLAGHDLTVMAKGNVASALTVTDTAADGELHVYVPEGMVVTNSALALSGAATLVKEGAGTLVTIATGQSNSGGTRVDCGTFATTNYVNSWVLGASGSKVEIGLGAMLRVENGYHGLENHNLVLAGGTLYMRNSLLIEGCSFIGSLTQTNNNSTIMVESTGGTDSRRDTEIASGAVWDLGNHKLTVRFVPGDTDLKMPNGLTAKNGDIDFPSVMPGGANTNGWWQMNSQFDAHDNVTVLYGMNTVRWSGSLHHSVSNFINQIPHGAGYYSVYGNSRMDIYGTFTPYPDVKTNICGRLQMMDGSTIDLSGLKNTTWSAFLEMRGNAGDPGGFMEYDETKRKAGVVPTIYIDLGSRIIETETGLDRPRKIVSWDETPKVDGHPGAVGVRFVEKNGRYSLYQASSGIYVGCGFRAIFK